MAAAATVVVLALLTVVRSQAFDTVTFGGDEYAYLARALFPATHLNATDAYLQGLSNHGMLALVRLTSLRDGGLELLHLAWAVIYAAGGVLTFLLARRFLDRLPSLVVGALYFLLPATAFVSTAMAEPVYAAVFAATAFVLIRADGGPAGHHALGAGLTIGVLYSVKPNALAVLLAACAYVAVLSVLGAGAPSLGRRAGLAAGRVALVIAGFWSASTLIAGLFGHQWSLSPGALIGGLYGGLVGKAVSSSFWSGALVRVTRYAAAHLILILTLFGVPAVALAGGVYSGLRRGRGAQPLPAHLGPGLFAALVLTASVAMVSIFSAQMGASVATEGNRLHERYYAFVLPLVMLAGVAAMKRAPSAAALRWGGVVAVVGSAVFALGVSRRFDLFPWDAPDALALFDRAHGPGGASLPATMLACAFAAGAVAIVRPRSAVPVVVGLWMVVFALGSVCMFRWQREHVGETGPLYREARAFSFLLRAQRPGSGVLVGEDRYGRMSYVLAGLAKAPHVRVVEGITIPAEVLPAGASWVVVLGPYVPGFAYEWAITGDVLTLYMLDRGGHPAIHEAQAERVEDRVELSLAAGQRTVDLVGFNAAESWGSWTATPVATLIMRNALRGPYRMNLKGWTTAEGASTPLRIRFGDREYVVPLGTSPGEHQLDIDVAHAADRFEMLMPIPPHRPWERPAGAAIQSISFARAR